MPSPSPFVTRAALAAVLLLAAGAVPAAAQELKVAVIDTERVIRESATGKAALEKMRTLREAKEAEGKALQDEIEQLRARLSEGRLSLAEDKLAELQQELENKLIALRRFEDDARRELGKRGDEVLATIDRKAQPIIQQVGEEQGYTLIFRKFDGGLLFAVEEIDITGEIIRRLDASGGGAAAGTGG